MPVGMKVGSGVALQPVWTVTVSVGIWQPLVHEVVTVLVLVVGQQSVLSKFCQLLSPFSCCCISMEERNLRAGNLDGGDLEVHGAHDVGGRGASGLCGEEGCVSLCRRSERKGKGRTGRSLDRVRVALGVDAAAGGERREAGRGPDDVGGQVGVEGQRGGGVRVVGVEAADGETAAVGVALGGGSSGAGGVLVACLWVGVGLGGGDVPELEAGEEAKGRESEGLHLGVWWVLVW